MASNGIALEAMVNAHEERVQRLESVLTDISSSLSAQEAYQITLTKQLERFEKTLEEKFENGVETIVTKMDDTTESLSELEKLVESQKERLLLLESAKIHSDKWKSIWAKIGTSLAVAAITAIVGYVVSHLE
jgi:copper homeostasis protein CutC